MINPVKNSTPRVKIIQKLYSKTLNPEEKIIYNKSQYKKFIKDVTEGTIERKEFIEETIEKFLKNKSISVQPKIIHHIMNFIERTYVDAFQAAEVINHLLYENNHNINLSLISEYYEQIQRPLS